MSQITLMRSQNSKTVQKVFYEDENGRQKRSVAHITEARAKHVEVATAQDFMALLKRVTQSANEVLCTGVFIGGDAGDFNIVTEAKLAKQLGSKVGAVEGGVHEIDGQRVASRLKRGMQPCDWILIDADSPKDMPAALAKLTLKERLDKLEKCVKGISKCERIELRSSSSRVRQASGEFGGASHAWIRVSHPDKIELLKAHLKTETDAQGLSYISKRHSTKDGSVVGSDTRTLIDFATLDTGRLVFCAKPASEVLGDEIGDAEITLVNEGCGELDISWLKKPTTERLREAQQKTGIERQYKSTKSGLSCTVHGLLNLDTPFEVKGVTKPIRDWIPEAKTRGKLRGEAPYRESQSEAAVLFVDDVGIPLIHDVGNNTTYTFTPKANVTKINWMRLSEWADRPLKEREWTVEGWIPKGQVTLLYADGGVGKSQIILQLLTSVSLGESWFGLDTSKGSALYLGAEDDTDELHRRFHDVINARFKSYADFPDIIFSSLAGENALLANYDPRSKKLSPSDVMNELTSAIAKHAPSICVIDTLADVFPADENDRALARQFIGMLRKPAIEHKCALMVLAHPSLSGISTGRGTSGSTGWNNSVRSRITMERDENNPDRRILKLAKSNYSKIGTEIAITWENGVFVHDPQSSGLDAQAANSKAKRVFLSLLENHNENGMSVNANGGSTYAPKVFAGHPECEGVTKKAFVTAMKSLLAAGAIKSEQTKRGTHLVVIKR